MRVNVDRVLERDQKLTELDNRAGTCCRYLLTEFLPAIVCCNVILVVF